MSNSKNDLAWEQLFKKYRIRESVLEKGHATILAQQINEFREARLMTKFDHRSQLPQLFAENNLSILPISRGGYIIGAFETFCKFNADDVGISPIRFPASLESLDYRDITSEATAINCAFVSGILNDFTGEGNLMPTVSGRMSSSSFSFRINSANGLFDIAVDNSQVEIDGGYEGEYSLNLIEAKNYISDDFLIRQLFYPYKLWQGKIRKTVRPIFLTYTNGVFHLREYIFNDAGIYNSLSLVKHKKYAVTEGAFSYDILQEILARTETVKEPPIPFPQADSFERVINLCELVGQREFMSKEEITQNFDFDERQTDYYSNAGKYLDLIETGKESVSGQAGCFLAEKGKKIFALNLTDRQKEFVKQVVSHAVFRKTLELYLKNEAMPAKETVVEIMKGCGLYKINSESTYTRRASTIIGWINWIIKQIEE